MTTEKIKEKSSENPKFKKFEKEAYAYALENALLHEKALSSAVLPKLFRHGLTHDKIKEVAPLVIEVVKKVNSLSKKEQEEEFKKYKQIIKKRKKKVDLAELPNAIKGKKMIFRLAPFPSGPLHLGNVKTFLINTLYAEKYKGKILLVMDDTIGSIEKPIHPEAYDLIKEAVEWLGIKYKKPIIYKSSRLKIYYRYAEKLIKLVKAYVCSCSQEEIKSNRGKMIECSCRQYPPREQIKRWRKMFKARQGEYILRLKTSMQHKNPAFRDRVLCRISEREHPRVGKKYRVWPLLDFSWAIDDHLLGITHIIRGKDLMMESEMEKFIWKIFNWKAPEIIHTGRIKVEGIKLSGSKSQQEVARGKFFGWHDPRSWSVQSLMKRGILPEAIREFVKKQGLNQNDITVPIQDLYAINRKLLDEKTERYFFVPEPIKIKIENMPDIKTTKAKVHPEKAKKRTLQVMPQIYISRKDFENFKGKEIRLLNLFNILLKEDKTAKFTSQEVKDVPKIQWVADGYAVKTKILMPDATSTEGVAETNIIKLNPDIIIQFERFGFCRLDNIKTSKSKNKTLEYEFWFTHT